jgi:hypothetical protein
VPSTGLVINPADGLTRGTWSATGSAGNTGTATGNYSAASGTCLVLYTGAFNSKSHAIRGRSFIVPLGANSYDTNGTLDSTWMGALYTAASAVRTGSTSFPWSVWNRPITHGKPPVVDVVGTSHAVIELGVHDRVAVLRSRRA